MLLEQPHDASSPWIVRDEDQEQPVLSALDRRHDAARLGTHPGSLVARLLRLQDRSSLATLLDRRPLKETNFEAGLPALARNGILLKSPWHRTESMLDRKRRVRCQTAVDRP